MAQKTLKMDLRIVKALHDNGAQAFSTTDLRNAYLDSLPKGHPADPSQVRKYIYKQILRLEKTGLIKRKSGSVGRGCQFVFQREPGQVELKPVAAPEWLHFEDYAPDAKDALEPSGTLVEALQEELKKHQVELMASVGEAEEYMRLYQRYPALKDHLKHQYHISRDRSSKLLGQVRAVEAVIAEIGSAA